jgi:hypothetical protein
MTAPTRKLASPFDGVRLDDVRTLVVAANEGNYAAGARRLGRVQSAVGEAPSRACVDGLVGDPNVLFGDKDVLFGDQNALLGRRAESCGDCGRQDGCSARRLGRVGAGLVLSIPLLLPFYHDHGATL